MSKNFLFYILQFFNFVIFLIGTFLLCSSLYQWILVEAFNSFITSILLISILFLITAAFGYFCVWNSTYSIILYEVCLFLLFVVVILLGFFLYFDEDRIISYMISSIQGVSASLLNERSKTSLIENIELLKIEVYISVFVIVNFYLFF